MKLLHKTVLITLVVVLPCSVILYLVSSFFLVRSYEKLEDDMTRRDLNRVTNAIDDRLRALGITTLDWAVWDDTYYFITHLNKEYFDSNLSDASSLNANLNLQAFYNLSNQLVFYKCLNLDTMDHITLTQSDLQKLDAFIVAFSQESAQPFTGLIGLDSGIIMAAANPIMKSSNLDSAAGILLYGRFLNSLVLTDIAQSTKVNLSMQHFADTGMSGLTGEPLDTQLFASDIYINKNQTRTLNAYKIIRDFTGQPCLVLETTFFRDVYVEGQNTIGWVHIIIGVLALVLVVWTSVMIYLLIIKRVKSLTSGLQRVAASSDLTIRMPNSGHDEISTLTLQTNSTLDQIARTQFELRSSEERFRRISEVTQDVIYQFRLKPELAVEYISPSVQKILGYTIEEIHNDPLWLVKTIHSEDRARFLDMLNRGPALSKVDTVLRWIRKDRQVVWMEHVNSNIFNEAGQPIRAIGAGRDISERINMQNDLIESYQKEKEIRHELEKEAKARAFFIDVLGHELKTPLTPLQISLDILKDKTDPNLTPLQNKLITNASDSVKILGSRLDELLDLTRFARGTFKLDFQTFNAKDFMENTVARFQPLLQSRRQHLIASISPDFARIKADPFRLEQVINNLLSNASKFSEDDKNIYFRAGISNHFMEVEVEDRGIGLTPEELKRLFEPYHRVEQDRQKFSGFGLGLAVSHQIVEAHGGHITVTSEAGRGSVFKFTIPLDLE